MCVNFAWVESTYLFALCQFVALCTTVIDSLEGPLTHWFGFVGVGLYYSLEIRRGPFLNQDSLYVRGHMCLRFCSSQLYTKNLPHLDSFRQSRMLI